LPNFTPIWGNTIYYCIINTFFFLFATFLSHSSYNTFTYHSSVTRFFSSTAVRNRSKM
jgi:hypothetical protein